MKALGIFLLALPVIAVFVFAGLVSGWSGILGCSIGLGICAVAAGCTVAGVELITRDR
jgi:hypothetical protein